MAHTFSCNLYRSVEQLNIVKNVGAQTKMHENKTENQAIRLHDTVKNCSKNGIN